MFLKRRNLIAWAAILIAALSWSFAGEGVFTQVPAETTAPVATTETTEYTKPAETTVAGNTEPTTVPTIHPSEPGTQPQHSVPTDYSEPNPIYRGRGSRMLWYLLWFAGVAAAVTAVFFQWQREPLLGPEGALLILILFGLYPVNWMEMLGSAGFLEWFCVSALSLLTLRELWGWLRSRFALSWCVVQRLAGLCKRPQLSLLIYSLGIAAGLVFSALLYFADGFGLLGPVLCLLLIAVLGICCLWRYGLDLHHFQKQLENYRNGLPIAVKPGAFSQTEEQLLKVQSQHEEAVQTAVTSERFKVELISNVSHDLRTPLTSILGYAELLQGESLSEDGQEQLSRLNQKAAYMRELVDSLFELTKVSSGVIAAKREEIDLLRLLEQTIGFFDDQLTAAGLVVRRHYACDTLPVITDGGRMHQVFANLLGNAIKYALPGTRIHLEVTELPEFVRVRMMNTASYEMDFSPEEITQRFVRGDKARSTRGSGLGLAIAQTYTQSVGGQFHVAVDGDQFSAIVELPASLQN